MKYLGPSDVLQIGNKIYHPGDDVSAPKAVIDALVRSGGDHHFDETDAEMRKVQEADAEERAIRRQRGLGQITVEEATHRLDKATERQRVEAAATGGVPKGEK